MFDSQYWLQRRMNRKENIGPVKRIKSQFQLDDEHSPLKKESFGDTLAKILEEDNLEEDEDKKG